ncbi:MAG: endonuclease/exonuclease/phosphatase family protein [Verrucomicrobia bacterium]|nr:endonuclease/exonuclease/phosphatase family protein [Verrucomicrobiota bacterium]
MKLHQLRGVAALLALLLKAGFLGGAPATFTVATYNVENYLDAPSGTRKPKPPEARAKVREFIRQLNPDVLALQEMGATSALLELRAGLKKDGVDFPHWEHVAGHDTNIHLAVLSKYPFTARRPHTNESFLLDGRRFHVSRGFAEVEIQVTTNYSFTLITAHLKSKRPVPEADQADLREKEAVVLREIIDARLKANPNINLVVAGDLNDLRDSKAVRMVIGRGKTALTDTRPAEPGGTDSPKPVSGYAPRDVTWTYHYGKEDAYTRIDYILLSRGMAREWIPAQSRIFTAPDWGHASDHRPLVVTFTAEDK